MWGLRALRRNVPNSDMMFPTHVGIARLEDPARQPAGRGQYSLRMWGLRAIRSGTGPEPRMFPTHVGIARGCRRRCVWTPDVPYACGDCAEHPACTAARTACSLRMWGLRGIAITRMNSTLMFPTHVGIARPERTYSSDVRHVPYACGDCASANPSLCAMCRCSLRMWGLRGLCRRQRRPCLMFPTHVGIAWAKNARWLRVGDVPYACGDCAYACGRCARWCRCSLRMWGLRDALPACEPCR